jgi:hypothetical protein
MLYAFDLIEHDGEDLRDLPFLDRKAALARLLRDMETGILVNEHVAEDGPTVFAHACRLGAEGIVSKRVDGTYRSGPRRFEPLGEAIKVTFACISLSGANTPEGTYVYQRHAESEIYQHQHLH